MKGFTFCVPTVPSRRSLLSRCLHSLSFVSFAEVLVADGPRPMGDKLNEMFAKASGRYVVAVDDDDYVTDYALVAAHAAFGKPVDFIGHDILWLENGRFAGHVRHHLGGDPLWGSLNRGVSPKCPVRTELARSVLFGNEYTADRKWSQTVHALCRSDTHVPSLSYVYDHWTAHMVGTEPSDPRFKQAQRDVGVWPYDESRVTWLG